MNAEIRKEKEEIITIKIPYDETTYTGKEVIEIIKEALKNTIKITERDASPSKYMCITELELRIKVWEE